MSDLCALFAVVLSSGLKKDLHADEGEGLLVKDPRYKGKEGEISQGEKAHLFFCMEQKLGYTCERESYIFLSLLSLSVSFLFRLLCFRLYYEKVLIKPHLECVCVCGEDSCSLLLKEAIEVLMCWYLLVYCVKSSCLGGPLVLGENGVALNSF